MNEGYFLTVKDLMLLTGCRNYSNMAKSHRSIRDAIGYNKRKLTIKEYCKYEGLCFNEIWEYLRN